MVDSTVTTVTTLFASEMIATLRSKAKDFEREAEVKRRQAREIEIRASEMYDAYISFDLLADKMEKRLAQAIEARRAEPGTGSVHESAVRQDAPHA